VDLRFSAIVQRQCGRVTWAQLKALGVADVTISQWSSQGRLARVLPRVYAITPAITSPEARFWGAVLYAGPDAMVRAVQSTDPTVQLRLHGIMVDAYSPEHGLVVELDGYANHSSPAQLHRDRERELTLRGHGVRVVRYDWALMHRQPESLHADLMRHLGTHT
jgi:hypothetical protein